MSNSVLHSATGKISKIILFDTRSYTRFPNTSDLSLYYEVWKNHRDVVNSMHTLNPDIEFFIFFRGPEPTSDSLCHLPGTLRPFEQFIKTRFIQVNAINPDFYIPTIWIQDILLVGPDNVFYYDENMLTAAFVQMLMRELGLGTASPIPLPAPSPIRDPDTGDLINGRKPEPIRGGDVLTGCTPGGTRYMLHGVPTGNTALAKKFDLDRHYVQLLDNAITQQFGRLYFHLDCFCMIVGETLSAAGYETVLLADPIVFENANGKKPPANVYPPGPSDFYISSKLPPTVKFRYLRLPMIIFLENAADGLVQNNIHFVMSYTNCIVENYLEDGRRVINAYFPDFRTGLESYVVAHYIDEKHTVALQTMFESSPYDGQKQTSPGTPYTGYKTLEDALGGMNRFLLNLHSYIITVMNEAGINNVQFVRHDFYELAQRGGSLHCIAKVVERTYPESSNQ